MKSDVELLLLRSLIGLLRVSDGTIDPDVREDLIDDALMLLRGAVADNTAMIASAIADGLSHIAGLGTQSALYARATVLLLRLQHQIGEDSPAPASLRKQAPIAPAPASRARLNTNQKRIVEHVRSHPGARTKELMELFGGELSDRTILRCLKELVTVGALERVKSPGSSGVSYRVL